MKSSVLRCLKVCSNGRGPSSKMTIMLIYMGRQKNTLKNSSPEARKCWYLFLVYVIVGLQIYNVCSNGDPGLIFFHGKVKFVFLYTCIKKLLKIYFLLLKHAYSNILKIASQKKRRRKFSDKNWLFSYFCSKHGLCVPVRTALHPPWVIYQVSSWLSFVDHWP